LSEFESGVIELLQATARLPKVEWKKLFGCDGTFVNGNIFGLVWKEGRIGVKLTDEADFKKLMSLKGSDPWQPGGKMTLAHWVLVPEDLVAKKAQLAKWLEKGHAQAKSAPPKAKKK
jgi:TfoX/Sxy family transcriptional regulator of competence genes